MNWTAIDEQHKATFHRDYVACHEPHERSWLVENVLLAFPQHRKSVVERAIQVVCTEMNVTPRKRSAFFEKLKQQLEESRLPVAELIRKRKDK